MTWVLDHLDDLESDFSAIHRIEDIYALDGPRFFKLAHRISAYQGVMQMRVEEHQAAVDEALQRSAARVQSRQVEHAPVAASRPARPDRVEVPVAVLATRHSDLIERVVVS